MKEDRRFGGINSIRPGFSGWWKIRVKTRHGFGAGIALMVLLVSCILLSAPVVSAAGTDDISLLIDGVLASPDVPPRIVGDRTLVPIRLITESLGWDVEWLAHTRQVLVLRGADSADEEFVLLTIDDPKALVNGEERSMDVPPIIISDRTMVPIRFVAEAFGSDVGWDGDTRTVTIASRPTEDAEPDGGGEVEGDANRVLSYARSETGLTLQMSGSFEWKVIRDTGTILMLRLMGTGMAEDLPLAQVYEGGPLERVSLSEGEGVDGGVYLSLALRDVVDYRIAATDEGLEIALASLQDVEVIGGANGPTVILRTTVPVEVRTFTLEDPVRAVIDLIEVDKPHHIDNLQVDEGILTGVRFGQHRRAAGDIFDGTRVVLDLAEDQVPVVSGREREGYYEIVVGFRRSSIAGRIIALDPGHGGSDPGATGPSGITEREINLRIAAKTVALLEAAGATVVATRTTDVGVPIYDRPAIANAAGAEVFISIHANADPLRVAEGTETYHYPNHDDSERLAQILHHQLVNALGSNDRRVRYGNFAVLRESKMPAALIECLYLSSPHEERRLMDPAVQENIARSILAALEQFFAAY